MKLQLEDFRRAAAADGHLRLTEGGLKVENTATGLLSKIFSTRAASEESATANRDLRLSLLSALGELKPGTLESVLGSLGLGVASRVADSATPLACSTVRDVLKVAECRVQKRHEKVCHKGDEI